MQKNLLKQVGNREPARPKPSESQIAQGLSEDARAATEQNIKALHDYINHLGQRHQQEVAAAFLLVEEIQATRNLNEIPIVWSRWLTGAIERLTADTNGSITLATNALAIWSKVLAPPPRKG